MSLTVPSRAMSSQVKRSPNQPQYEERDQSTGDSSAPQEPIYRSESGYHVIVPDSSKNTKLKQMAKKEEEIHQQYKQSKTPSSFHTSSRLGGQSFSMEEVREKQETTARIDTKMAPIRRQMDRERRREEREERERIQIMGHKQRQREKSERLEEKRKIEEPLRQEEMRRKRLAYFDNK